MNYLQYIHIGGLYILHAEPRAVEEPYDPLVHEPQIVKVTHISDSGVHFACGPDGEGLEGRMDLPDFVEQTSRIRHCITSYEDFLQSRIAPDD